MKMQPGVWCGFLLLSAGLAVAESKKDSQFRPISPAVAESVRVKPAVPPSNAQQGNNPQGQFPPGKGPNNQVPPPAQGAADLPAVIPQVPGVEGSRPEEQEAAHDAATIQETLETFRPVEPGLDINELDADDARKRDKGTDPENLFNQHDPEMDAGVEALRNLTEGLGSNRDGWSDTTKGYAALIETDPQSLLSGARAGRASDRPTSETRKNPDGTTTETIKRHDDHGNVLQLDEYTRDSAGTVIRVTQQSIGVNGLESHVAVRNPDGSYSHSTSGSPLRGSGSSGQIWQSPNWDATVDPDSDYGHGGSLPGKETKTILEKGKDASTPGGRPPSPDDQGGVGGPRLNVDVDLAGQPNPDSAAGGSAIGTMIKNPNDDTVDPPPPIR